jgi:hypothetical protein
MKKVRFYEDIDKKNYYIILFLLSALTTIVCLLITGNQLMSVAITLVSPWIIKSMSFYSNMIEKRSSAPIILTNFKIENDEIELKFINKCEFNFRNILNFSIQIQYKDDLDKDNIIQKDFPINTVDKNGVMYLPISIKNQSASEYIITHNMLIDAFGKGQTLHQYAYYVYTTCGKWRLYCSNQKHENYKYNRSEKRAAKAKINY